jgi:hypothetical protein
MVRRERRELRNSSRVTTEACRRFNGSKATHRIIPLFDATMILLQPMSEIFTRSMLDSAAHRLADGSRIGSMAISRHLIGNRANHSTRLLEKLLSCFPISLLARAGNQPDCQRGRSPDTHNVTSHARVPVRLIDIPGFPGLPLSLDAQLVLYQGGQTALPSLGWLHA